MNLDYLTDIIILLTAAVIIVPLSRLARLGVVPGFLMAGIVVGPFSLGLIDNQAEIAHLAELGVVLLLFVIGIELKPSRLWLMRRLVFGLGALQVVVTGVLITAVAHLVFKLEFRSAILIGPALALSSTAFVLQLLSEQKMLNSDYGRSSIAVLLFQDLAVVPLLALASLLTVSHITVEQDIGLALLEALVILALIIFGGRYLLHPLLHRIARQGSPELFTASAVLLVLGTGVLMAQIGLSMAMGAFVAGLLVADSEFRHQVTAEIQPFRGLLIGLFFMSMGMSLEIPLLFSEPLFFISMVVMLMLAKGILIWLLAMLFGLGRRVSLAIALLLAQSGEFALVLFAVALNADLLSDGLFQQLLVVVVLSMLATPPLAALAYRLIMERKSDSEGFTLEEVTPALIVILGFGRVGRRVGEIFEKRGVSYIAVDSNAGLAKREHDAGRTVYFGDAREPNILNSLDVKDASLIIVTIDDFQATEQVVSALHCMSPNLNILARAHDMDHCKSLQAKGARVTVSENLEASIALAQSALVQLGVDETKNSETIECFRKDYYER
jgi:monovalent cation:proton antiporter-2 (CPA2) family protein